jgi:hypothetical protein
MKMQINRIYNPKETLGALFVYDDAGNIIYECVSLELPWLKNTPQVSCIPEGVYPVTKITSPINGPCFLLANVPGRASIEMHIGNYAAGKRIDTKGCILPGQNFQDLNGDGILDVAEATITVQHLLSIMPDSFQLTIAS